MAARAATGPVVPVPTKCPVSAHSTRKRRRGYNVKSGARARLTENQDAAAGLREGELHGGEARRRVKGAAAAARNLADVERQRHPRALGGHRLGE